MTDTNKRLAIVTDAGGVGVMRATEQPITLEIAGKVDPQRTTDFQAVLLAMAGHDLRQPLQIIQSTHERLGIGIRTKSNKICCRRVSTQSIASVGSSINCWGLFASLNIPRR
jgi:two-component system phosphate regulon sensor histidine kinase PhoR